ncbi:MAG: DNA polymerase III subunit gamma/tau [Alphaproteobacteria bacterium]|nr:DNA polymerase III subunit gamma/tau [Alphaproteobacteria bacterium]
MSDNQITAYRVLARKYRPDSFETLIGQDALVRTLSNALELGRLAHAFVLTGVRGIGKTSTARILARGLNCEGADGTGEPTLNPCGVCRHCRDIADSRHIDVLEMDAASNTGVDDVREIIDGANYRPVSARFKIYIIDEVHMLSRNAFNALLKTLEEPPDNVKFIFATTEIRKVPVTILSRCQRFDLRRVPNEMMTTHLANIAKAEGISVEAGALTQISRASEGSVRDALSLLDQAAAMGADKIDEAAIITMLGQAETGQVIAILEACFAGQTAEAVNLFLSADAGGAEAETILADMLDLLHQASLIAAGASPSDLPEDQLSQLRVIADMGIAKLGRAWQVMLNGHRELKDAPSPKAAAQMVLIRLAHLAPMPTPADIIKTLQEDKTPASPAGSPSPQAWQPQSTSPQASSSSTQASQPQSTSPQATSPQATSPQATSPQASSTLPADAASSTENTEQLVAATPPAPSANIAAESTAPSFASLRDIADYFEAQNEKILNARIKRHLRVVSFGQHKLEVVVTGDNAEDLPQQLAKSLSAATGAPWLVSVSETGGGQTLAEEDVKTQNKERNAAAELPLVASVLEVFEGAKITAIRQNGEGEDAPQAPENIEAARETSN